MSGTGCAHVRNESSDISVNNTQKSIRVSLCRVPPLLCRLWRLYAIRVPALRSTCACRVALYVALADSSVGLVDAEEGSSLSNAQWVRPKNACTALALALLDVQGQPVGPYAAHLQLHWASNNAAMAAADSGKPFDCPVVCLLHTRGGCMLHT